MSIASTGDWRIGRTVHQEGCVIQILIMIKFPILRFHTGRRQAKGPGWRCPDIHYQFELFAKFGDSGVASIQIIINHLILRQINLARV